MTRIAFGGDQNTITIELKISSARIGDLTRWTPNLEETTPLDHQVQRIAGRLKAALCEDNSIGNGFGPKAKLEPRRNGRLRARRRTGLHQALIEQVLKLGTALLEADRVGIGQIVGDVVDAQLLRVQTAGRAIKCSDHLLVYPFPDSWCSLVANARDLFEPLAHFAVNLNGLLQCFKLAQYID